MRPQRVYRRKTQWSVVKGCVSVCVKTNEWVKRNETMCFNPVKCSQSGTSKSFTKQLVKTSVESPSCSLTFTNSTFESWSLTRSSKLKLWSPPGWSCVLKNKNTHMNSYMSAHICVLIYVCSYMCAHIYVYKYIHCTHICVLIYV